MIHRPLNGGALISAVKMVSAKLAAKTPNVERERLALNLETTLELAMVANVRSANQVKIVSSAFASAQRFVILLRIVILVFALVEFALIVSSHPNVTQICALTRLALPAKPTLKTQRATALTPTQRKNLIQPLALTASVFSPTLIPQ
jgi:hypothetical protein